MNLRDRVPGSHRMDRSLPDVQEGVGTAYAWYMFELVIPQVNSMYKGPDY